MITRFAPSPTGPLHLGHAYSALLIDQYVQSAGGRYLLRIEDTDSTRCRPQWEEAIYEDLAWLGITWETPVRRQSEHYEAYWTALEKLRPYLYPCSCTRRDIKEAGAQPGADGLVYPGTCRNRLLDDAKPTDAIRLNLAAAIENIKNVTYNFEKNSENLKFDIDYLLSQIGDPVLKRKDTGDPAYHLACVVDDGLQNITHVIRGADLLNAAPLHIVLQALLGLPTPIYTHHDLIRDETGKRLAKINASRALSKYRDEGATPDDIRALIGL